jgi:hypothetical protein
MAPAEGGREFAPTRTRYCEGRARDAEAIPRWDANGEAMGRNNANEEWTRIPPHFIVESLFQISTGCSILLNPYPGTGIYNPLPEQMFP